MLLAIDVGNTHTVLGLFDGAELRADWRIGTRKEITDDELGVLLRALFQERGLDHREVDGMIVSSVVPNLGSVLASTGKRYFGCDPLQVGPGVKTGMAILYENPHEVGADRIVNAVAAVARCGAPAEAEHDDRRVLDDIDGVGKPFRLLERVPPAGEGPSRQVRGQNARPALREAKVGRRLRPPDRLRHVLVASAEAGQVGRQG